MNERGTTTTELLVRRAERTQHRSGPGGGAKTSRRREGGFTFLEVLTTMLVFGILLAGLVPVLVASMQVNGQATRMTSAVLIAQDKLEELRGTVYPAVTSGSDSVAGADGESYARSWNVTESAGSTKAVTITVGWTGQRPHTVTLETLIADF